MRANTRSFFRCSGLAFLAIAAAACGGKQEPYDWKNRVIPWTYTPTKSSAPAEHLQGTGTKGGKPLAVGWKCNLVDGKALTINPFELAKDHALFGKVKMIIGMFDQADQQIGVFETGAIDKDSATSSFDVDPDVAKKLAEVVIAIRNL